MLEKEQLMIHLDSLHSTVMGVERIRKNLDLNVEDVVLWCKNKICKADSQVIRKGKNWYVSIDECEITINTYSYTIITAHKVKKKREYKAIVK